MYVCNERKKKYINILSKYKGIYNCVICATYAYMFRYNKKGHENQVFKKIMI